MRHPIHILAIDDDPEDIYILHSILAPLTREYRLFTAGDFQQAFAIHAQHAMDIILLDLGLPGYRDLQALRALMEKVPDVPIVVFTNLDNDAAGSEAIKIGAQDYLLKGKVSQQLLTRTIRYAMERFHILQELQIANQTLSRQAILDPLTDILNRRGLKKFVSMEVHRAKRTNSSICCVLLDLDNFKAINDSLGHASGDVILKEVAHLIKEAVRPTDHVARIGGDEFMMVLPHTDLAQGVAVAERVRLAVTASPVELDSKPVPVTASLGVALIPIGTFVIDALLEQTHYALKKSKESGKNQTTYVADAKKASETSRFVVSDIERQLRTGEGYSVLKQPIVNIRNEQVEGYEYLSRGAHGPFRMPKEFFRVALEKNMLTMVDLHCLQRCLDYAHHCSTSSRFHVNLFPSTLLEVSVDGILQMLPEDFVQGVCCLEISEQQLLGDPSHIRVVTRGLQTAGVRIAIDDVGFGRSSLENLILLNPDIVKIDRKFVRGIAHDKDKRRCFRKLLGIIDILGSEAIAEGIETRDDFAVLQDCGVPMGQGFLWGRPD